MLGSMVIALRKAMQARSDPRLLRCRQVSAVQDSWTRRCQVKCIQVPKTPNTSMCPRHRTACAHLTRTLPRPARQQRFAQQLCLCAGAAVPSCKHACVQSMRSALVQRVCNAHPQASAAAVRLRHAASSHPCSTAAVPRPRAQTPVSSTGSMCQLSVYKPEGCA